MPRIVPVLLLSCLVCATAAADKPFPAHRVIGNVYYVGSDELATYLITTPEGHLLINSGFDETVPLIRASVESLGFKMNDVKILLASHAHSDHVAGHERLQQLTGAKVYVMRGDQTVIADGGRGNVNPGYRLVRNPEYPQIAEDFAKTFTVLKKLPCDVFLGAHGNYYGMHAKHDRLAKASANPFIDPQGFQAYVAEKEQAYRAKLADQRAE